MTIASILTLVRPGQSTPVLDPACELADTAHLEILVVAEAPPPPASAYDVVNGTAWLEAGEMAREAAEDSAKEIREKLNASGRRGEVSAHVAGPVHLSDLIASAGRCADMVMLPVDEGGSSALGEAVIHGALFETGTPLMTFAAGQTIKTAPETVVIAWKATPEGGRAVRAALPFLKTAKRVVAALIDPRPAPRGFSEEPGFDLATYLGHHGVSVEVQKLPGEGRPVSELLASVVKAEGADLLVMGAYGHARLRERIFGGTTKEVLKAPPAPTLMMH